MAASDASFGWGYYCGEPSIKESLHRKVDIIASVVGTDQRMECLKSAPENMVHKSGRCKTVVNSAFASDVCRDVGFVAVAICVLGPRSLGLPQLFR